LLLWKYGKRIRMSSTYAHISSGVGTNHSLNESAVDAGADDSEKKFDTEEEKEEVSR
jgi:hypothetical protein